REGKGQKKRKLKMKNRNINYKKTIPKLLIALVLGCFSLSPAVQATSDSRQPKKFTQIDVPGAIFTAANGINARGDIVGLYLDTNNRAHGLLLSSRGLSTGERPQATLEAAVHSNQCRLI